MSLTSFLPAPTQLSQDQLESEERARAQRSHSTALVSSRREPPPYGYRKSWVPRSLEDFGDGGAFPEIHVAQFPLEMGRKKKTSNALAVQVDAEGKIKYDAIARQGQGKDKVIFSKYTDLLPKEVLNDDAPELQKPDEEAVKELTEKTRDALMKQVSQKIAAAMPVRAADKQAPAQYIRYTPSQQGVAFNSGAKQRVIRMVEMQKDPMEPPRFKINKKIPRGPPSPPAPVMHSPSRKMTVKEQQEWKIPPCISNWKNAKGYTIPLDKRLAADGRGLQTVHINENFAKLAEALYIADRKAREAVEMRAQVEKKMAQKEKEKKEEKLRELAQMARDRRAGIKGHGGDKGGEDGEARERDEIRHDRRKERQHDRNISRAAPDKRSKLQRDQDRDVSELIALGQPNPRASNEAQYDQRLFNQSKGMDSGFAGGEDEMYNVYDQPFRRGSDMAQNIYRPTKSSDKDMYGDDLDTLMQSSKFVPDREFSGTDHGPRRDGPVQFEEDPFGLDKFLEEAKQHGGSKRPSTSRGSKDYDHDKKRRKE
ncbi:SNW domain-containing protein 1 [Oncorhynchus nerka]|uniref:SNW domain-containing protein 1 n=2 Tax=Oncorhynchus TaxID=8016 RepID=A0A8C7FCW4_ONCKI|nr:SNW domain-containing protein 1 [Oncorhynchus nerka]XP_031656425.1 SNW domain-containing protein 1 [Oncorhynchus kisutch]XP_042156926.1 SNW domain-containing protein 1 [Oncorhynchus tshawytscha]XP_046154921.1 SNW domain-containing protein 1 [Oncorhynchus gorbuscha]XP_052380117.1 SNW domain-containing protein 1 [Oncorhynchus keta]